MARPLLQAALLVLPLAAAVATSPAFALSTKECSAKYQAAKQAGTLNGQKWNDFRKAACGADAAPAPAAATVPNPLAPAGAKPAPAPAAAAAKPSPAAMGAGSYPAAVDPKYASEPAGKQRMHTCLDSYNAAKAAGTLGDRKWIQKGGGYYSECNKRLKG